MVGGSKKFYERPYTLHINVSINYVLQPAILPKVSNCVAILCSAFSVVLFDNDATGTREKGLFQSINNLSEI